LKGRASGNAPLPEIPDEGRKDFAMKKANRKVALRPLAGELALVEGGIRSTIIDTGSGDPPPPPPDDPNIGAQIVDFG
jgi:hypothetical protein